MFQTIRSIVGRGRECVLYECRRCGTTVEAPGERCPDCGATDVARFLI